ncbi:MAG: LamG domain-containing protein [Fuerstiella sp.]
MSEESRREFLRSTSATLAAGAILGSVAGRAANRSPTVSAASIPPHRPRSLEGVHAYADQLSVAAGARIRFHVSSTHAYEFQVCRLGSDVDSPANDEVLKSWQVDDPRMQPIHPGSYLNVEKGLLADRQLVSLTVECWVRLWDLFGEQAILGQFDRSRSAGFALLVNREGRIGFYLGDGGAYQEKLLLWTDQDAITRTKTSAASVAGINRIANGGRRIERAPWQYIVATFDGRVKKLWLDGKLVVQGEFLGNCKPGTAPLRIGAWGRDGQADGFLDADIAMPAIYAHSLSEEAIERRYQGGGLEPPANAGLLGCWPLDEEKGDRVADCSGNGRHARIINQATWMIGGPSFPANVERFGDYDPANDDRRGHGLRLASDDLYDCRWQPTIEYRVPTDAKPGIYVGRFRFTRQKTPRLYHALFIVRKPDDKPQAPILFVCSTSTWKAYAGTPFAESWPDVKQAIGHGYVNSPGDPPAFSLYWRHKAGQGVCQMGMRTPWPIAGPYTFHQEIEWECSHLCHADRLTMAWLEAEGYDFDVVSDLDLHQNPERMKGYKTVFIVGHSEYWSAEAMEGLGRYYQHGGTVVCLSGNSMYWRVSFSDDGSIMECRKAGSGGSQILMPFLGESWHSHDGRRGSLCSECGYPAWRLLGLQFMALHAVVAEGVGPYRVSSPDHFLFNHPHALEFKQGDYLGQAPPGRPSIIGHEGDIRISTLARIAARPLPAGATHPEQDPAGITLLAAGVVDWSNNKLVAAPSDYYSRSARKALIDKKMDVGAEMIYWERADGGRVFNAGSVSAGRGFAYDPKFGLLIKNVLHHFGVPSSADEKPTTS